MSELIGPEGAMAAGAAWAGRRLLGPLFTEVGQDLRQRYADRRKRNIERIFENAERRAGADLDKPGQVPGSLVRVVLDDASWTDDPTMAEYFGGIMAASRTAEGRDDRGTAWAALVAGLSAWQVRAHYVIYRLMRELHADEPDRSKIGLSDERERLTRIYVPWSVFGTALGLDDDDEEASQIMEHSIIGLLREGLMDDDNFVVGSIDLIKSSYPEATEPGLIVSASVHGVDLFLWAHGIRSGIGAFLDPSVDLGERLEGITIADGAAVPGRT
jgi:hypothetical protein